MKTKKSFEISNNGEINGVVALLSIKGEFRAMLLPPFSKIKDYCSICVLVTNKEF